MKVVEVPEFLLNATNVYRTDKYIVRQQIVIADNRKIGTYLLSNDTYYLCTAKRDRQFEEAFADRTDINGKRISTSTYIRKYVN